MRSRCHESVTRPNIRSPGGALSARSVSERAAERLREVAEGLPLLLVGVGGDPSLHIGNPNDSDKAQVIRSRAACYTQNTAVRRLSISGATSTSSVIADDVLCRWLPCSRGDLTF